jgi:hypothetical protein
MSVPEIIQQWAGAGLAVCAFVIFASLTVFIAIRIIQELKH